MNLNTLAPAVGSHEPSADRGSAGSQTLPHAKALVPARCRLGRTRSPGASARRHRTRGHRRCPLRAPWRGGRHPSDGQIMHPEGASGSRRRSAGLRRQAPAPIRRRSDQVEVPDHERHNARADGDGRGTRGRGQPTERALTGAQLPRTLHALCEQGARLVNCGERGRVLRGRAPVDGSRVRP